MWKSIPEWFQWPSEFTRIGIVSGLLAGCGSGDSVDESGGGGTDAGGETDGDGTQMLLGEPLVVGEHTIPSAELMLAGVVEAKVRFARCSQGTCTGHFQLSEQGDNPVGFGLGWVERHELARSTTTQYAPLSNGSAGFGGVSVIDGLVSFDPTKSTGTLILQGSGRDTFGDGAFASALFRLELDVSSRLQP